MANERPLVVIIEDQPSWSTLLTEFVGDYPSLVLPTLASALAFLREYELSEGGREVAAFIVDGNLSNDSFSGVDGDSLVAHIRNNPRFDTVPIIGNSGSRPIEGADYNLNKSPSEIPELPTWITSKRG